MRPPYWNYLVKIMVSLAMVALVALGYWWFTRPPDPFSDAAIARELHESAVRLGVSESDLKLSREMSEKYVLNNGTMSPGDWAEIKKRLNGKSVECRLFLPPTMMALNGPFRDDAISELRRLANGTDAEAALAAQWILRQKGIGVKGT